MPMRADAQRSRKRPARWIWGTVWLLLSLASYKTHSLYETWHWTARGEPWFSAHLISQLKRASVDLALAALVVSIVGVILGPRWLGAIAFVVAILCLYNSMIIA